MTMPRRGGTWRGPGGQALDYTTPRTAREVLDLELLLYTELRSEPTPRAVAEAVQWARAYVSCVEAYDLLSPQQALDVALAIYAAASLPAEVTSQITSATQVTASGGCECRICAGRIRREEARAHDRALCRYRDVGEAAEAVLHVAAPLLDGNLLDAPWWVYQARRAVQAGQSAATRERESKAAAKRRADEVLARRGR